MLPSRRLLLRAEVRHGANRSVAYTTEVSERELSIQMDDPPPIGAEVQVTLSFPRTVRSPVLDGRVQRHHQPTAPGELCGATVRVKGDPSPLAELLARCDRPVAEPSSYRVLVIDDSALTRDVFATAARRYFHGAVSVASGTDEALRLARASHYDLAIVDYYLGSENGGELVSQLRAEFGVSVVTMSVGGAEARQHMLAAGADLHLDKPVALGDLFFTIEQMAGEASGCGSES